MGLSELLLHFSDFLTEAVTKMNNSLSKVKEWFLMNKLNLNPRYSTTKLIKQITSQLMTPK